MHSKSKHPFFTSYAVDNCKNSFYAYFSKIEIELAIFGELNIVLWLFHHNRSKNSHFWRIK